MGDQAFVESVPPEFVTHAPEPWWERAWPRRAFLLALALVPLLTPVISPTDDGPFIYPYTAAVHLLAAWFCWKASLRYPAEKVRWQTVVLALCVHSAAYVVASARGHEWVGGTMGAWIANASVAVCWVLFLPALMGVRSVRGIWVRSLDYALALVVSALAMRAMGSGMLPGRGMPRIMVGILLVAFGTVAAVLARVTSARPGIKLFSSVMAKYLGASLLAHFALNIVNLDWLPRPNLLASDLLIALPELWLCDLAVSRRRPMADGPELEPVMVDSLQPSMMAVGGVLLALYGFRGQPMLAGVGAVVVVVLYALRTQLFYHRLFVQQTELRTQAIAMEDLATRDALTGVGNRRWFDIEAERLLGAPRSFPCSVLLVDTDKFKDINDTFGHPLGDEVLRGVAAALSEVTAQVKRGCCARIGGDEFGAMWPGTSAAEAQVLAESFRSAVGARGFSAPVLATVSVGVATLHEEMPLTKAMRWADSALYRAKSVGRNAVRGIDLGAFIASETDDEYAG